MTDDVRPMYVIDEVLVDGRPVARIREVLPGAGKKGVQRINTLQGVRGRGHPRRRLRTGVHVALVAAVLGVLVVLGWAVYLLAVWVVAHAFTIGALVALAVLLAGAGGGCTVIVTHVRR